MLSEQVISEANGNGANGNGSNGSNGHSNGGNGNGREHATRVAVEVGAAILANAEARTAEHSDDVVLITEAIGERMGIGGKDADELLAAARLHDIGKAWLPGRMLDKAGPLSDEEWELMRQHTVVGERILSSVAELRGVGRLVRHSHERWDGGGYPDGLAGAEIPLGSRIIFCADAFHAIRSDRPYRPGRSANDALAEIERCAGSQFDPDVVRDLVEVVKERRRRPRGTGRSARLFALLMCLVVGGAGSAIARSGLLGEPNAQSSPGAAATQPPPGCGTGACPSVAVPVGGLAPVGIPGVSPGPRPLHPGLPGLSHAQGAGQHGGSNGQGGKGSAGGAATSDKSNQGKSAEAKARQKVKSHGKPAAHSNGHGAPSGAGSSAPASPGHTSSSNGHHSGSGSNSGHQSGRGSNGGHDSGGSSQSDNAGSPAAGTDSTGANSGSTSGGDVSASPGNSGNAPGHNK